MDRRAASLSSNRQALMEQWLAGRRVVVPTSAISVRETAAADPSFRQLSIWIVESLEPNSANNNQSFCLRLKGQLKLSILRQSLSEVVQRHEILRTGFTGSGSRPKLKIHDKVSAELDERDLRVGGGRASEETLVEDIKRQVALPFVLANPPLLRAILYQLDEIEYALLLVVHHVVFDGWSAGILQRELFTLYQSLLSAQPATLPLLDVQYADYAAWQVQQADKDVWTSKLKEAATRLATVPVLNLPHDSRRRDALRFERRRFVFELSPGHAEMLRQRAREYDVSIFTMLLAGFGVFVARLSGLPEFLISVPVANRGSPQLMSIIGPCFNIVPLHFRAGTRSTFIETLGNTRSAFAKALALQEIPIELVTKSIQLERRSSAPLFNVSFALQNFPFPKVDIGGLSVTATALASEALQFGATPYEFGLTVMEADKDLLMYLEYDPELFDRKTIEQFSESFKTLLLAALADPAQSIWDYPCLTSAQIHALNEHGHQCSPEECCTDLVSMHERQAARTPNACAIVDRMGSLTYKELHSSANKAAHYMRSLGVSPDDRVAIYALSSIEYSVAMLGVLKSGGCYVPIDVSYPPARVQHILASSGCRFVLCDPEHLDRFDAAQIKVLPLDQLKIEASGFSSEPLTEKPSGTSLCYVIYTSGSTGQPKGVAIPHRAAANHMTWMQREYALTETDRVLQRTPIGFDASIWEFHAPLTSGATLVVPESDVNRDPASLIRAIKSNAITVLQVVPALLQSLVALNEFATIRCLRRVFCGGEQLAPELVRRFHGDLDAGLINLYGPTEATIDSTSYNTKNEDPVPIGRPIDNVATYVLDPELRRVPYGALGELYIGGGGLARGYLNASAMTAEVFLPDPYATEKGSRMYRTGDLVRRRNDGQLEWLGRLDRQVKLRGYRLELGEIENVLLGCDHVAECSVLVQSTGQFDARLIAFVVPVDSHTLVVQVLRDCLLQLLPPYMVPGRMFLLECLPRTEHGKIDKMRLAEIARTRPTLESSYVHSRNSEEGVIAAIWARALEVDAVGIDDNFFELGGSSLTILRVHELISEQWPGRVSLMDLFRYTTVRSQAGRLSELSMPQNTINEEFDRGSRRRMAARRSRPLEEK